METFETIEKRRSIRNFNDLPVEWEKVGNILRAAQLAPTSGNVQDFKFVVVTDKTKRAALANAALKQHWIAKAPVIIIVYSEPKPTQRFYGLRGEKLYTIQNSAAAAENILLAATDQGLASCWVGAFDETMVNSVIGAPDSVRPQAIIPIGYSDDEPDTPKRHRLVDLVYINSWRGKIVNIDLLFDDFSDVLKKKLVEAKEAAVEKGPTVGVEIAEKGKAGLKKLHEKIKEKIDSRKKKKDKEFDEEIGGEEEVLDETDNLD
ncbi:nitroreductase family protein [Candidatus Woesearchaeota archaeon]|nr:nitroreductase family protein [Candidatus Woesearchaeota archaeon]